MPPRDDLILFLDLETTGTDVPEDNIIEVGLSLLSADEGYPEVAAFSSIVMPSKDAFDRLMRKRVVREMHKANGLLDELLELRDDETGYNEAANYGLGQVAKNIDDWLTANGGDSNHIPLGGSGVTHFDRKFIKAFMPGLDARLTHWAYDVGVMRRMFIKAGVPFASIDAKTHRALDDARVHAEEFRFYQSFIRGER